jgi:hypothetical protein
VHDAAHCRASLGLFNCPSLWVVDPDPPETFPLWIPTPPLQELAANPYASRYQGDWKAANQRGRNAVVSVFGRSEPFSLGRGEYWHDGHRKY